MSRSVRPHANPTQLPSWSPPSTRLSLMRVHKPWNRRYLFAARHQQSLALTREFGVLGTNGCVWVWVQVQGKISALEKEVKRARAVEEQVKKDKVSEPRATAHPPCDTVTTVPALLPNLTPTSPWCAGSTGGPSRRNGNGHGMSRVLRHTRAHGDHVVWPLGLPCVLERLEEEAQPAQVPELQQRRGPDACGARPQSGRLYPQDITGGVLPCDHAARPLSLTHTHEHMHRCAGCLLLVGCRPMLLWTGQAQRPRRH